MAKDENLKEPRGPKTSRFKLATGIYSLIVIVGAGCLGFFSTTGRVPIDPHEWGDVLAGFFSPLAFLWLVYASLSQKAELELQRGELERNNIAQRDQYEAMKAQAGAMRDQVKLMQDQATTESHRKAMEARELRVWCELYLQGIARYHDALINHASHMGRDLRPKAPLNASAVDDLFGLDRFRGTLHTEQGVPRFHYFDETTQADLISLIGRISQARIAEQNYKDRVSANGEISAEDIDGMNAVLNGLASEAHRLAGTGLLRLRQGDDV